LYSFRPFAYRDKKFVGVFVLRFSCAASSSLDASLRHTGNLGSHDRYVQRTSFWNCLWRRVWPQVKFKGSSQCDCFIPNAPSFSSSEDGGSTTTVIVITIIAHLNELPSHWTAVELPLTITSLCELWQNLPQTTCTCHWNLACSYQDSSRVFPLS
jgi:hypothetical protein